MQDYGIVTCSRHLNLTDFEAGASCSIALQGKAKTGYPRVSRGSFLSGYGSFLCYYAHLYSVTSNNSPAISSNDNPKVQYIKSARIIQYFPTNFIFSSSRVFQRSTAL